MKHWDRLEQKPTAAHNTLYINSAPDLAHFILKETSIKWYTGSCLVYTGLYTLVFEWTNYSIWCLKLELMWIEWRRNHTTFDPQLKDFWPISDLFGTYLRLLSYFCVNTQSNLHEQIRKQIAIYIVFGLFQLPADRLDCSTIGYYCSSRWLITTHSLRLYGLQTCSGKEIIHRFMHT